VVDHNLRSGFEVINMRCFTFTSLTHQMMMGTLCAHNRCSCVNLSYGYVCFRNPDFYVDFGKTYYGFRLVKFLRDIFEL
jgi:hypothetical protein